MRIPMPGKMVFILNQNIGNNILSTLYVLNGLLRINPSLPSAAYMRQLIGSVLVQIMACRLFGAKPLSTPMLGYCQLHP